MKSRAKEVTKIILLSLLITGGIAITLTSPYAGKGMWKCLWYEIKKRKYEKEKKMREEKWKNSFYYLRREGFIETKYVGKQVYVSLTKKGKEYAKKCKFDDLTIKKSGKWDGKWRILVFDISDKHRIKREALRGKIKELGLYQFQKSVWVHPYDFREALEEMKKFFLFKEGEVMMAVAQNIDGEEKLKSIFNLK